MLRSGDSTRKAMSRLVWPARQSADRARKATCQGSLSPILALTSERENPEVARPVRHDWPRAKPKGNGRHGHRHCETKANQESATLGGPGGSPRKLERIRQEDLDVCGGALILGQRELIFFGRTDALLSQLPLCSTSYPQATLQAL